MTASALGTIVAVVPSKGGCGATTIACHLARAWARSERVVLVDLDVGKGNVAGMLDLPSPGSLSALVDRLSAADEALVTGATVEAAGGHRVLGQPTAWLEGRSLDQDEVRALLQLLAAHHDRVVIDLGSGASVTSLAAIAAADRVVYVAQPTILALQDLQRLRRTVDAVTQGPHAEERIVINGHDASVHLPVGELIDQLDGDLHVVIPADADAVAKADRAGTLVADAAPRSDLARALEALAARLDAPATPASAPVRRGWFG